MVMMFEKFNTLHYLNVKNIYLFIDNLHALLNESTKSIRYLKTNGNKYSTYQQKFIQCGKKFLCDLAVVFFIQFMWPSCWR